MNLISAFNPNDPSLSYHSNNKVQFTEQINSDGSCGASAYPSGFCDTTVSDDSRVFMFYNPDTDLINLNAKVTEGSFLGFGWGGSMTDTEMVIFSADGTSSTVGNYYSTTEEKPTLYPVIDSCYTSTVTPGSGYTIFNTTRPLDCGIDNTYVVQLDTNLTLINAWNPNNP